MALMTASGISRLISSFGFSAGSLVVMALAHRIYKQNRRRQRT